jgi:hypothetical protein
MQQQGLTNIEVTVGDVGVSEISIDRLDFTYEAPDTVLRVELEEVHLAYDLSQLLLGQAEDLLIESVAIKLDYQSDPQANGSPTLPSIELLLAAYDSVDISSFPVNNTQLPQILILHNLASESELMFDEVMLQVQIAKFENGLRADVLNPQEQALSLIIDEVNGWQVQFFDKPTPAKIEKGMEQQATAHEPALSGSLKRLDQSLRFSTDLRLGWDKTWSRLFEQGGALQVAHAKDAVDFAELNVAGTIEGIDGEPGLVILSSVAVRDLSLLDFNLKSAIGEFDTRLTQANQQGEKALESPTLNITSRNSLSLNTVSFADWQVGTITLTGSSELRLTDDMATLNASDLLVSIDNLQNESELKLSEVSFSGSVAVSTKPEYWQVDLPESWKFQAEFGQYGDTIFSQGFVMSATAPMQIKSAFTPPLKVALQPSTPNSRLDNRNVANKSIDSLITLEKTSLEIRVPVVRDRSLPQLVKLGDASLQINQAKIISDQLFADGALLIPRLSIIDAPAKPPQSGSAASDDWQLDNLKQTFALKGDLLKMRGSLDNTQRDIQIETSSKHDFKKQQGDTELRFKPINFDRQDRLKNLLFPLALPLNVVTGAVDLTARARWTQSLEQWQTTVGIETQLNNLGGAYGEVFFSGVNGDLSMQVYPQILSSEPHKITVNNLDIGVASTESLVEFNLRPSDLGDLPVVDILRAQTQVLQGSMSLKPAVFDLNRTQQNLVLVLEDIDLSELVSLHQLEDIQATGRVTGELPIMLNDGKISIDDGQLHAIDPGGTLKYRANEAALGANKYAETVMLALKNFNYDVLRADTQYDPDGSLLLKLRLQGNNPDFEKGRPVNLNINLEQNILKLFESLRLIEGVSDRLDKRVQDFYQQSTSP